MLGKPTQITISFKVSKEVNRNLWVTASADMTFPIEGEFTKEDLQSAIDQTIAALTAAYVNEMKSPLVAKLRGE